MDPKTWSPRCALLGSGVNPTLEDIHHSTRSKTQTEGARHRVQSQGHCPCGQRGPSLPSFLPFSVGSFPRLGLTFLLLSSKTSRFTTQMDILKMREVKGPKSSEGLVSPVKDFLEQNDSEALWI